MAIIREQNDEVRLFVIAYVDVALQGNGDGLEQKALPMWALMRACELNSLRNEDILGINYEGGTKALFVERKVHFSESYTAEVLPLFEGQPVSVRRSVNKAIDKPYGHSFIAQKGKERHIPGEVLRMAVLVELGQAREIMLSIGQGQGVFLAPDDLELIDKKMRARQKRNGARRTIRIGKKRVSGFRIEGSQTSIHDGKLIADLNCESGDIAFVHEALHTFQKRTEDERSDAWEKSMNTVWG